MVTGKLHPYVCADLANGRSFSVLPGQQPVSHQSASVNHSTFRIASHLQATILLPLFFPYFFLIRFEKRLARMGDERIFVTLYFFVRNQGAARTKFELGKYQPAPGCPTGNETACAAAVSVKDAASLTRTAPGTGWHAQHARACAQAHCCWHAGTQVV